MRNLLANNFAFTIDLLNTFADSTGDYYYIYDLTNDKVFFSYNTTLASDILNINTTVCSLEAWRKTVYTRDIIKLKTALENILNHNVQDFNLNYRVKNKYGNIQWINSKGRVHRTEDDTLYILGRLSLIDNISNTITYNVKAIRKLISNAITNHQQGYLIQFGIDNLKYINLQHGRNFGDALINDVYTIIKDELASPSLYRVGGDCFAILLLSTSKQKIIESYRNIQQRLIEQCTISAGCVDITKYYVSDENTLLQYAENALYNAKNSGKNNLYFFTPKDYENKLKELELVEEIKKDIKNDYRGFAIFYQPQLHGKTFELIGAEALLRYSSQKYQKISNTILIPLLEQYDLIYEVGLWVMKNALAQAHIWRQYIPDFNISVNMSLNQLTKNTIEEDVIELVDKYATGNLLTIELTESIDLINYPYINQIIKSWKKHGIRISIDDFGTGYSSLTRLQKMDVDEIKIDRSFVKNIQSNIYNFKLVSNIIELARNFQITVCCEGIETKEELSIINKLDPAILQGFVFSKPIDAQSFAKKFINIDLNPFKQFVDNSLAPAFFDIEEQMNFPEVILNSENDVFYLSNMDTYELFYLNKAGQQLFNAYKYKGKKCYEVLHGYTKPCEFCTNKNLKHDSFYIWENRNTYCNRLFLLKDKAITYKGKVMRLEVALDITNQEYISQQSKDRLEFVNKISGYMETLSSINNYNIAIEQVLASVADFYQADRAYLFEKDIDDIETWNNTYEWCQSNIIPQKDNLQHIPTSTISCWLNKFANNESIIIYNLESIRESSFEEWKTLKAQDIQRLIAVPINENNKTIGFVGVDNPRYSIADDTQIRVLASFILSRMHENYNEHQYQTLLREYNQNFLSNLNIGFWVMKIAKNADHDELTLDEAAKKLLGIKQSLSPKAFLNTCRQNLTIEEREKLAAKINKMTNINQPLAFNFHWLHPEQGLVQIYCIGALSESNEEYRIYKGYSRI